MKITWNCQDYELIMFCVTGSRLYGTENENSDYDYRGVFIAPLETKIGLLNKIEQIEDKSGKLVSQLKYLGFTGLNDSDDIVLYELNKFFKLAEENNPNIMDILNHPKPIYLNDIWNKIYSCKSLFISKKIKHTFSGYSFSQLTRLKNHQKYINKYPLTGLILDSLHESYIDGDINSDFIKTYFGGEVYNSLVSKDDEYFKGNINDISEWWKSNEFPMFDMKLYVRPHIWDYLSIITERGYKVDKNDIVKNIFFNHATFQKIADTVYYIYSWKGYEYTGCFTEEGTFRNNPVEVIKQNVESFDYIAKVDLNKYQSDIMEWNHLWNWKVNRNKVRSALEDKIGYDSKHAYHLVRLLIKANEILSIHEYYPKLEGLELQEILQIKNGNVPYDDLIKRVDELMEKLEKLYETSDLQYSTDIKKINKLLLEILLETK